MGYKGEDLDLRTPPAYEPSMGAGVLDPVRSDAPYRATNGRNHSPQHASGAPVWVDDTLLTCANHAYDVAFAHRAAEVRIEHLLYAITRVDAASEILEMSGVRDAGLRRESAMVIASAIPGTGNDTSHRPPGSQAFKQVLALASDHASTFNRAAGIVDLLHVLTFERPDLPGADLLHRHMGAITSQPQSTTPTATSYPAPPPTDRQVQPMPPNQTSTDASQDRRIEALEALVRSLGHDLRPSTPPPRPQPSYQERPYQYTAAQPQSYIAPPEQLRPQAPPNDGAFEKISRNLINIAERIERLEDLLNTAPRGEIDLGPLDTRLNDIEVALLSQDSGTGTQINVDDQLDDLRDGFAHSIDNLRHGLHERIDKLDQNSAAQFKAVHDLASSERGAREQNNAALGAELKALSGATATHAAGSKRQMSDAHAAVAKLGEMIARADQENATSRNDFIEELREVHDAIMKLNTNQHTMAESITSWHRDHVSNIETIGARVETIDRNTSKPLDELQKMSANVANLSANMDTMYRTTVQRYHRRNRLWFWLFGTDDWIGASWPSQTARIENELRALKRMRDPQ